MPRNAPDTAGRWRVWLWIEGQPDVQGKLIWDRKIEEVRTSDCRQLADEQSNVFLGLWRDEGAQAARTGCAVAC